MMEKLNSLVRLLPAKLIMLFNVLEYVLGIKSHSTESQDLEPVETQRYDFTGCPAPDSGAGAKNAYGFANPLPTAYNHMFISFLTSTLCGYVLLLLVALVFFLLLLLLLVMCRNSGSVHTNCCYNQTVVVTQNCNIVDQHMTETAPNEIGDGSAKDDVGEVEEGTVIDEQETGIPLLQEIAPNTGHID